MFYDWKKTNDILNTLNITPNQAWLVLMFMEQDYNYKTILFNGYVDKFGGFDYTDIVRLEELGYIENCSATQVPKTVAVHNKVNIGSQKYERKFETSSDVLILELFVVTPKFREIVYIDAEIAGEELFSIYPSWITITDKGSGQVKRQSIKIIPDRNAFYAYYYDLIQGDILKHKYICEMFKHYRKLILAEKIQGMGILKALESRLWTQIEELLELEEKTKDTVDDI